MRAIAVKPQATTVAPATSNSKDDSNIMTAHNSRNASNSRNESRKQQQDSQHCMVDSKSGNAVKIKDDNSSRDNSIIMDIISIGTVRIDCRENSNIQPNNNSSRS
jgi:hypothetical protein